MFTACHFGRPWQVSCVVSTCLSSMHGRHSARLKRKWSFQQKWSYEQTWSCRTATKKRQSFEAPGRQSLLRWMTKLVALLVAPANDSLIQVSVMWGQSNPKRSGTTFQAPMGRRDKRHRAPLSDELPARSSGKLCATWCRVPGLLAGGSGR